MDKSHVKSFLGGIVAGAGLVVGGVSLARSSASSDCMNRPVGSCWVDKDRGLKWVIEFLGQSGITPLMGIVFFLAATFLLAIIYFTATSSNRTNPFMYFARGAIAGLLLGAGILALW